MNAPMSNAQIIEKARRELAAEYLEQAIEAEEKLHIKHPIHLDIAIALENPKLSLKLQLPDKTFLESAEDILNYALGKAPYQQLRAGLFCGNIFMSEDEAFGVSEYLFIALMGTIRRIYRERERWLS